MSKCFSEPEYLRRRVKGKSNLSNYDRKTDLEKRQVLISQNFLKKLI